MKNSRIAASTIALSLLGGCAALNFPQDAPEFRSRMPSHAVETIEIKRPFQAVVATLKKKVPECLNTSVVSEDLIINGPYRSYETRTRVFKPTLNITDDKLELYVQLNTLPRVKFNPQNIPPDGYHLALYDASAAGKDATRLTIYGAYSQRDIINRAVKNWVAGTNMACPDLTSIKG